MARPQTPGPCEECERSPAAWFTSRRQVGVVFRAGTYTTKARLCREHAVRLVRSNLLSSLAFGWWGIVSFFVNLFVIGADVGMLFKARRLSRPV